MSLDRVGRVNVPIPAENDSCSSGSSHEPSDDDPLSSPVPSDDDPQSIPAVDDSSSSSSFHEPADNDQLSIRAVDDSSSSGSSHEPSDDDQLSIPAVDNSSNSGSFHEPSNEYKLPIPTVDNSSISRSFSDPSDCCQTLEDNGKSGHDERISGLSDLIMIVDGYLSSVQYRGQFEIPKFRNLEDSDEFKKFFQELVSFGQELKGFFRVPNQQIISNTSPTLSPTQFVAAFVSFLLQMVDAILAFEADYIASVKGSIQNLRTELNFLSTFLGDTPMHLQPTMNILIDVETMVNEIAGFLCCFILTILVCIQIKEEKTNNATMDIEAIVKEVRSFFQPDHPFTYLDTAADRDLAQELIRSFLDLFNSPDSDRFLESGGLDFALSGLLLKFEALKTKIKEHCIAIYKIPGDMAPNRDVVSFFIVDSVLDDLLDLMSNKSERFAAVNDQILTLHQELDLLRSSVMKIAKLEEAEHEAVMLRTIDVAYEVEYVINSLPPVWYFTLRLSQLIEKIQPITTAIQEKKKITDADAIPAVARNTGEQASSQSREPTVLQDIFVGFEKEKTKIMDQLVRGPNQLQIISIFGMPGLGKTTLATKLYNHSNVVLRFDVRGWCVVSQIYKKKSLLIDILMSISHCKRDTLEDMDEGSLADKLYKNLKGRRYLVVIDDIWDIEAWNDHLRRYFPCDNVGSRILFTTRNREVGLEASSSNINPLPFLSDDECWELLQSKVFQDKKCPHELIDAGKQIAKSCHGLPLAVVVIAGVLAGIEKKPLWQKVAGNLSSHISGNPDKILELSYNHLPMHLKPCFLYFATFKEDEQIPVTMLMTLWISEGFIRNGDNNKLEDVAMEYVMNLIDRILLLVEEQRLDGGIKTCKIHDLLREMCSRLAGQKDFMKVIDTDVISSKDDDDDDDHDDGDGDGGGDGDDEHDPKWFSQLSIYQQHQRLAMNNSFNFPLLLPFGLHLRSLTFFNLSSPALMSSSTKVLRALRFYQKENIYSAVMGINHLVQLRYLAIPTMPTCKQLPPMEGLDKLEFLDVDNVYPIEIPDTFLKMVTLRQVDFKLGTYFSESCRQQAAKGEDIPINVNLESIRVLSMNDERDEKVLRCFPNLKKLKCKVQSSLGFSFDNFNQLESLKLEFYGVVNDEDGNDAEWAEEEYPRPRLISFSFPSTLKKLTLSVVSLTQEQIEIIGGLQYLEVLKLETVTFRGGRWDVREDEFPQLKCLKLSNERLEEWNASSDDFPSLQRLVLQFCDNLEKIPPSLGDILTLEMIKVYACSQDVKDSAKEIQEEQEDNGNEVLKVIIS